jgi:cytosine/adenosine deaminase-related metal-dependent hydrolase
MASPKKSTKKAAATAAGDRLALTGGLVAELAPLRLRRAVVVIADGHIESIGESAPAGVPTLDCTGLLVMAGLVDAHARLASSAAAIGRPVPRQSPQSYVERLERITWPTARALDGKALAALSEAAALSAVRAGVTTVFDLVDAPTCAEGALDSVAAALEKIGLRGVLAFATACRTPDEGKAGLRETQRFLATERQAIVGMAGCAGAFVLDDPTADGLADIVLKHKTALHAPLAADTVDGKHGLHTTAGWLRERQLIGHGAVLAHAIAVADDDASRLRDWGVHVVHCPRAEQDAALDFARPGRYGERVALGSGGATPNILADAYAASLWASGRRHTVDIPAAIESGRQLASWHFHMPFTLAPGAAADLIAVDYQPSSPLDETNLAAHVVAGLRGSRVVHAIVDGRTILQAGTFPHLDEAEILARSREAAQRVWSKL